MQRIGAWLAARLPRRLLLWLAGRPEEHKVLRNTGWLMGDRIVRLGIGFAIGVLVNRYLGPDASGQLNYAAALVALFGPLASLGLDSLVVRDLVRDPADKERILGTAFVLKGCTGLGVSLLSICAVTLLRPDESVTRLLVILSAAGVPWLSLDVVDYWFQSQTRARQAVLARNSAFLALTGVRLILIALRAPIQAFAWAALAEVVLAAVGLAVMYRRDQQSLRAWRFSLSLAGQLLRQSWPLILSGLAVAVYMKIDLIILGELMDDAAVGIYGAAVRLSEVWYFLPTALVPSVFPTLVATRQADPALYRRRLQHLFDLLARLGLLIALVMTLAARPLVVWLYGERFAGAGPILAVHIWAALFVFLGVAQSAWDITEGLTKLSSQRALLGALINIGLNIWLIPIFGGLGSAIATLVAYACSACLLNAAYRRTRPVFRQQMLALCDPTGLVRYAYHSVHKSPSAD